MWLALRAELVYFRPWLLGGLGIATGVALILTVLVQVSGDEAEVPAFLPAMFFAIAGMVVSFIAQGYRVEERRARLLLAGTLTPVELGWVTALLPVCLVGVGFVAVGLILGASYLLTGTLDRENLRVLAGIAGQFLAYAQLGPLAQEANAARRQRRFQAAVFGWAVFGATILMLTASFWYQSKVYFNGHLWILLAVALAMVVTVVIYRGRTDFTR